MLAGLLLLLQAQAQGESVLPPTPSLPSIFHGFWAEEQDDCSEETEQYKLDTNGLYLNDGKRWQRSHLIASVQSEGNEAILRLEPDQTFPEESSKVYNMRVVVAENGQLMFIELLDETKNNNFLYRCTSKGAEL